MLNAGQQLNRYRIVRLLGSGGMGDVYLAEDPRIEQQVALKTIRTDFASNFQDENTQEKIRLFEREVKTIAKLDHPHILPLYDYGEQQLDQTTFLYLVMPYRPEGSLTRWISQRYPAKLPPPQEVVLLIQQAAGALDHAHRRQIIHQDVKPSNFLIRQETPQSAADALLSDFGVARLSTMTSHASQSVRGTPIYMAPEQCMGNSVAASDQYALAIMAYELLTGRPPFQGNPMQVMFQHIHEQVPPPSSFNPLLPSGVNAVLLHALAKRPEERFENTLAFANALQQALEQMPEANTIPSLSPLSSAPVTPALPDQEEIRSSLAISANEASTGTTRTITLPGGKRVPIAIPAGVENGHVLRLEEQSDPALASSAMKMVLTILVKREDTEMSPLPMGNEKTVLTPQPQGIQAPQAYPFPADYRQTPPARVEVPNAVYGGNQAVGTPPTVFASPTPSLPAYISPEPTMPAYISPPLIAPAPPIDNRRKNHRVRNFFLILLVAFLIAGSVITWTYYRANNEHLQAIAAANAVAARQTSTAIAQNQTGTAVVQAQDNATGTAVAQAQIDATSTAVAQARATAVFIAAHPYPAYFPNHGTLAFYDPLSQAEHWSAGSNTSFGGSCQFTNGAFHNTQTSSTKSFLCLEDQTFSNFAFEVQMKIVQGDCGGIIFRSSADASNLYYFEVCQNRGYLLSKYVGHQGSDSTAQPAASSDNSAILGGLGQTNLLAVTAQGQTISVYVNRQQIDSIQEGTFSKGFIGLVAASTTDPTEVVYTHATVWTL